MREPLKPPETPEEPDSPKSIAAEVSEELLLALEGGVHRVSPVEETPSVQLRRWRAYELPDGHRHLVGWNVADREGRVSSQVIGFDPRQACLTTDSGRRYELVGSPGDDADAAHVWGVWSRMRAVDAYRDVSEDIHDQILNAKPSSGKPAEVRRTSSRLAKSSRGARK